MKKLRLIIFVAMLVGLLVAPVAGQDAAEVTFMRFFGECADEFGDNTDLEAAFGECGIIQTLTNAYNASQDEVVVETVVVDWPGVTELNANLAAGTPPDIMVLHGNRIPNYASRGLLTPLGDVLEAAGIDANDLTDSARGFVEWNGEIYGIPLDLHGHLWHINLFAIHLTDIKAAVIIFIHARAQLLHQRFDFNSIVAMNQIERR
ncbi:MAG: extracellular solute-binding protein [Chloroflexi bacterium]|nr:MAG: extracellular solute-binding protein [Chloroflexota bacterium]